MLQQPSDRRLASRNEKVISLTSKKKETARAVP